MLMSGVVALAELALAASLALTPVAGATPTGLLDGGPGVSTLVQLLLALSRARNLRCIFLLLDDEQTLGLESVRIAGALSRQLAWAGSAATLVPYSVFFDYQPAGRCLGRGLNLLTASDTANGLFLRKLSEKWQHGTQKAMSNDSTWQSVDVSRNSVWLLFLLNTSISSMFADITLPYDSEILAAKQYREMTDIWEAWRVAPGLPLQEGKWGHFSRNKLRPPVLSLYDRRPSLNGAIFTVITQHNPPFSLVKRNDATQKEEAVGFMGSIWMALQRKLNFTTRWLVIPESEPKDRTFLELTAGRADVALMDYTLTLARLAKADFSTPVLFTSYRVFIADAGYRLVNWMSYMEPFRPELWAVELLTMCTLAVTLAAFYHTGRRLLGPEATLEDEESYTFYNSMFYVFGAFCMQGHDVTPRSCALRVVYLVAYLTAIILMAAYSAALISFLAVQATALPFADVAGLLSDGRYKFATALNSSGHQIIKETTDRTLLRLAATGLSTTAFNTTTHYRNTLPDNEWPSDYLTGLQELCHRRLALLAPLEYALNFANRIDCKAVPLPGFRLNVGMAFAFAKRNSYKSVINHNLDRMRKSGALSKLLLDARPPGSGDTADATGLTDVDLGDVAPLLAALAAGTATATLFLCAERLLYRRKGCLRRSNLDYDNSPSGVSSSADVSRPAVPGPVFTELVLTAKNRFLV